MSIDDVSDIEPRRQYVALAAQSVFDYPFPIFDDADLVVDVDGAVRSDYTVAGAGNDTGGTFTFIAPLVGGEIVTVWRETEIQRTTDFQNNGPFTPARINDELDRITIVQQELKAGIGRSIRFPMNSAQSSDGAELAPIDSYKDRFLYVNTDGELEPAAAIALTTLSQSIVGTLLNPRTQGEIDAGVTPVNLYERNEYIERQGAVTGLVTSQLNAINRAISSNDQFIRSHDGDFLVSAAPTNPFGKEFLGSGAILKTDPVGGFQQLNTYADLHRKVLGKEYRFRIYSRLANAGGPIKTFLFGDSTVTGGTGETAPFALPIFLPEMCRAIGLKIPMVATNRGVSGSSIGDMNALPDLAVDTDLFIIKYGINDGALPGDRLTTFATNLGSKLAAIRAATFGGESTLTICLVGPNSTNDSLQGRDERWYEQIRNVYVRAARDYKCVYVDTYGLLPDSRSGAGLWLDDPFFDGRGIHPFDNGRAWIWSVVIDSLFGEIETINYRGNKDINTSGSFDTPTQAAAPSTYAFGRTVQRALTANSWPEDGTVITERHIDGPAMQRLFVFSTGRTLIMKRVANLAGDSWNLWTGQPNTLTFVSGWVNFGVTTDIGRATLNADGIVVVNGTIKSGTTTAGTLLTTLPAGMRPIGRIGPFVCATNAGTCQVVVDGNGQILLQTAGDATYTALELSFRAA